MRARIGLRTVALLYLGALLLVPVGVVLYRTFEPGVGAVWDSVTTPAAQHAFMLTVEVALITVPLVTVFGVLLALVLVRGRFPGKTVVETIVDLPFAISPVVVGIALVFLYGRGGWIDPGFQVLFSMPGIVLATVFVCLPFVAREVAPVLREIGDEQEQAAATLGASGWQTFWRITLPAIRWGVVYGVVLSTARVLGEFGAVSVVSGRISGQTETLPLFVRKQFEVFNSGGGYAAALVLAVLALLTLVLMNLINRRKEL